MFVVVVSVLLVAMLFPDTDIVADVAIADVDNVVDAPEDVIVVVVVVVPALLNELVKTFIGIIDDIDLFSN